MYLMREAGVAKHVFLVHHEWRVDVTSAASGAKGKRSLDAKRRKCAKEVGAGGARARRPVACAECIGGVPSLVITLLHVSSKCMYPTLLRGKRPNHLK